VQKPGSARIAVWHALSLFAVTTARHADLPALVL
jgi:hypothetical protein